jgi:hypothetical protein
MTNRRSLNHTLARSRLSSHFECAECEGVPELGCVDCALRIRGCYGHDSTSAEM